MGCFFSKGSQQFEIFTKAIKEEAKRKSVYQYQIAHFRMLTIEKKKLPDLQSITETKIMKIKNVKRLADLKRVKQLIPSKEQEMVDVSRIQQIEKKIERILECLKQEVEGLLAEEVKFLEAKNKVSKILTFKSELEHKSQSLELKIEKNNFLRRFSMRNIENVKTPKIRSRTRDNTKKYMNTKLIHCIRRLERIENISENGRKCKEAKETSQISALHSEISLLNKQKEELLMLKGLDEIEKSFEGSLTQISNEVDLIKTEYQRVSKLNEMLTSELMHRKNHIN